MKTRLIAIPPALLALAPPALVLAVGKGPARRGIVPKILCCSLKYFFWCFQKQSTAFFGFFFGVNASFATKTRLRINHVLFASHGMCNGEVSSE
jgi:hypothetical protein